MSSTAGVRVDRRGPIGWLILERPDRLNAFDQTMADALIRGMVDLTGDARTRVVVITGAGRAFCAGADVAHLREILERRDWDAGRAIVDAGRIVVTAIRQAPKPVMACVNGAAAGGGANLALACDIRIASERASIGQVFNRLGLHPDWGGTYFLPRLVGSARAVELMLRAEMVPAAEALRLGLFSQVVPHHDLERHCTALAEDLASKPADAVALAKRAVYDSERHTLAEMLEREVEHQLACMRSPDATEGITAFVQKRAPVFGGG